jgi:hypothetical protein
VPPRLPHQASSRQQQQQQQGPVPQQAAATLAAQTPAVQQGQAVPWGLLQWQLLQVAARVRRARVVRQGAVERVLPTYWLGRQPLPPAAP